jgi:hypothetical protein
MVWEGTPAFKRIGGKMTKRPFLVGLLAVLALLGVAAAAFHALQFLGVLSFSLGPYRFFGADWLAAVIWAALAAIYLWVFRLLWAVEAQGWLFVTILSSLNLVMSLVAMLGESSFAAMLPSLASLAVNALILVYCLLPGTKSAFGVEDMAKPDDGFRPG